MARKKKRYRKSSIDSAEGKMYGIRKAWESGFILPGKFYREREATSKCLLKKARDQFLQFFCQIVKNEFFQNCHNCFCT